MSSVARPRFMSPATVVAIFAATIPGLFQGLAAPAPVTRALVGALVAAILLVSTVGIGFAERRSSLTPLHLTLATYGGLVFASLVISNDRTFLVAMPFLSMLVLFLSFWPALGGVLVTTSVLLLVASRQVEGVTLLETAAQFASAAAFVLVFSLIARRERYARLEVERLSQQVAELATVKERNRVARELHDSLGHALTIASVQLEAARAMPDGESKTERIERAQLVIREGLGELRNTVSLLREAPPRPLTEALAGLVADTSSTGLPAAFRLAGERRSLTPDVDSTLFRAAQEALTNVRRHARATHVEVRLAFEAAVVRLTVIDDGVGSAALREGNGLTFVRERVAQLSGTVQLDRVAGGGLQLIIEVPSP